MFSSLYNSEKEDHFDYSNSTTLWSAVNSTGRKIFMNDDDKSKDDANSSFWETEFGEISPSVTTTPSTPQQSTGNMSMEGKSLPSPAPTNLVLA